MNQDLGKLPPQAIDLERAVLSAVLLFKHAIHDALKILYVHDFYDDNNAIVWKAILSLFNHGSPIDSLTIVQELLKSGDLETIGGVHFVSKLTNEVSSSDNIESHAMIIKQKSMRRQMIAIAQDVLIESYDETIDSHDVMSTFQGKMDLSLKEIQEIGAKGTEFFAKEAKQRLHDTIESRKSGNTLSVPYGIKKVDEKTGGKKKANFIVLAARPGMGKTAFIISCIIYALKMGKKVAVFELEMTGDDLMFRIAAQEVGVSFYKIDNGFITEEEHQKINVVLDKLARNKNLFVRDKPKANMRYIRSELYAFEPDEIWIDYLQLMTAPNVPKNSNREAIISDISRDCKVLAKELRCPVIALAQLNRSVETRGGDKKPMLSDIRESGSIEQDADQVFFLWRPSEYGFTETTDVDGERIDIIQNGIEYSELIAAKNRGFKKGIIPIGFIGETMKFTDWEVEEDDIQEYPKPNF